MKKNQILIQQFVQDVLAFSSQYGSDISISYTAYNITGKPSKFPDYGDFPQCFVMRTYGRWWNEAPSSPIPIMPHSRQKIESHDFIDVLFERAVYPFKVHVFETYNPGALVRIWAFDSSVDQWSLLWEGPPMKYPHLPRKFSPNIKFTDFPTRLLRLEFNHDKLEYYTEIDAVLLVGSEEPIPGPGGLQLEYPGPSGSQHQDPGPSGLQLQYPGKITSRVRDLNLQSVVPQVDINESITTLLNVDLPNLMMRLENATPSTDVTNTVVSFCNFDKLADEMCLKIFSYLDLCSLRMCTLVNKRFYSLATDLSLFRELNLKPFWHRVNSKYLMFIARRCKFLQKLDLSWCGPMQSITSEDFVDFLEFSECHLTHIRVNSCMFMDNKSLAYLVKLCPQLKELSLGNCINIDDVGFVEISELNDLERLDLYHTQITLEPLKAIIRNSPRLQHLNIGSCVSVTSMDEVATTLSENCPRLISVDFWKTYSLTPDGVTALSSCRLLEEIDIGWCLGVSAPGDCLQTLASRCHKLKKLFLAALRGISNKDIETFIEMCPDLEQVDLMGSRNITSHMCFQLLMGCPDLRMLDLSFCEQIEDSEVAYWRAVFKHCSIKRSLLQESFDR